MSGLNALAISTKICSSCEVDLPLDNYTKDNLAPDGLKSVCRGCRGSQWRAHYEKRKQDPAWIAERLRRENERRHKIPERMLWTAAKSRATKDGIPFTIEESDIIIPDFCPILGIPLFKGNGQKSDHSPSLDKIVPSLGYVPGNIQVTSWRANRLKNNSTFVERLQIALWSLKREELLDEAMANPAAMDVLKALSYALALPELREAA